MGKYLSIILMSTALMAGMTSCMDDFDAPDLQEFTIFSTTSVGEINTSIAQIKSMYCSSNRGATYSRNASNWEFKVDDDLVFEGVVVSNDGQWGALYQQVILRSMDGPEILIDGHNVGHCIQLGVKNTCLYPYFQIGQKLKVNLRGLYVGVYSKTPKIGFPYFTSAGNHNLGPMPFEMCATNIELVGQPDPDCVECLPVSLLDDKGDAWLRASVNQNYRYSPLFATVRGWFPEADGKSILAPEELEDAGFAVDRTLRLRNGSAVTVRTSTGNELSQIVMPKDQVVIRGILSFYDGWQLQFRDVNDMKVLSDFTECPE